MNTTNFTWDRFKAFHENPTKAFEEMTRLIFTHRYLQDYDTLQANHNNPGVEVEPILEPEHEDERERKRISFQSKFFENRVGYQQIYNSAAQAVQHYKGRLDLIYLFCNLPICTHAKTYQKTEAKLSDAGIELKLITGDCLIDLAKQYQDTREYFLDGTNIGSCVVCGRIAAAVWDNGSGGDHLPAIGSTGILVMDRGLLEKLVSEKLDICRNDILTLDLAGLQRELGLYFPTALKESPAWNDCIFIVRYMTSTRAGIPMMTTVC